jgi:hypothetical protein
VYRAIPTRPGEVRPVGQSAGRVAGIELVHNRAVLRHAVLVCLGAACSSRSSPKAPARDAARPPIDAAPSDVAVDAQPLAPRLSCASSPHHLMGEVKVTIDPTSLRGDLLVYDASHAPSRHLLVLAKPTPNETVLVFESYAQWDSTFKHTPVPHHDRFAKGAAVARIVNDATPRLMFDQALQLDAEFDSGSWTEGYRCH